MSINWTRVIRGIANVVGAILRFFGRLLQEAWFDLWRRSRPTVIRWLQIGAGALILFWTMISAPELMTPLMGIVILVFGFRFILLGMHPKRRKKRE